MFGKHCQVEKPHVLIIHFTGTKNEHIQHVTHKNVFTTTSVKKETPNRASVQEQHQIWYIISMTHVFTNHLTNHYRLNLISCHPR